VVIEVEPDDPDLLPDRVEVDDAIDASRPAPIVHEITLGGEGWV